MSVYHTYFQEISFWIVLLQIVIPPHPISILLYYRENKYESFLADVVKSLYVKRYV